MNSSTIIQRMNETDWQEFLRNWNRDLLSGEGGWLGQVGASSEQIVALEQKLGVALSPSYRAFLRVSNGFRQPGHFVPRIFGAAEVDWLKNFENNGIEEWIQGEQSMGALPPISDAKYFVYGPKQGPETLRSEYLRQALKISETEEAGTATYC